MSLLADDQGAFDEGGARVVDAVEHRLHNQLALKRRNKMSTLGQVPLIESSWLWCGCFNGQQLSSIPNLAIAKCRLLALRLFDARWQVTCLVGAGAGLSYIPPDFEWQPFGDQLQAGAPAKSPARLPLRSGGCGPCIWCIWRDSAPRCEATDWPQAGPSLAAETVARPAAKFQLPGWLEARARKEAASCPW